MVMMAFWEDNIEMGVEMEGEYIKDLGVGERKYMYGECVKVDLCI